jgi:hypothetical protein
MMCVDDPKTRFMVEKLPTFPQLGVCFNIKIDKEEYIFDKNNLLELKEHIERALNMN